jgi:LCP family protein required for cell wall assembly
VPPPGRRHRGTRPPGEPAGLPQRGGFLKGRSRKSIIFRALAVVLFMVFCSGSSFYLAKAYRAYVILKGATGIALPTVSTGGPQATPLPNDLTSLHYLNLLLLGSDNDAKFASGAVLTQTVIVVRVDFDNKKVTMVSLPRDLWIPTDFGACCNKLDEISGNETDGARTPLDAKLHGFAHTLAAIEKDFSIPISAYAWVGLDGFVKVIDTLGGVDVDVLHPIVDDTYPDDVNTDNPYAYKRLDIPAGPQHLDGRTALEYVRSRHSDATGDFGRSARQQSVLAALKKKLDDPTLLTKLDEFATDLQGSVLTSLQISQVIQLAQFARGLKSSDITQMVLSPPDYGHSGNENGKDVVEPNWDAISQTVKQVFPDTAQGTVSLHNLSPTDMQTISQEGAHILIENGSGVAGLALKLKDILTSEGFNVVDAKNADRSDYLQTHVQVFNTKANGTATILGKMLGVLAETPGIAGPDGIDIVIIIGQDDVNAIS